MPYFVFLGVKGQGVGLMWPRNHKLPSPPAKIYVHAKAEYDNKVSGVENRSANVSRFSQHRAAPLIPISVAAILVLKAKFARPASLCAPWRWAEPLPCDRQPNLQPRARSGPRSEQTAGGAINHSSNGRSIAAAPRI